MTVSRFDGFTFPQVQLNNITPFTYRDGYTYLQLLEALRNYVINTIVPTLDENMVQIDEHLEQYHQQQVAALSEYHDRIVDSVNDFQAIHDAYMNDVNASLMALNDVAVTQLTEDTESDLYKALQRASNMFRESSTGIYSVLKYGADPTGATDSITAFNQAISDAPIGGTVYVPPGTYYFTETIVIDKVINLDCGRGGQTASAGGTVLRFAPGVGGIRFKQDDTGYPASGWRIGPFEMVSDSTTAGDDIGFLATTGPGVIDGLSVSNFGSHGIALIAGVMTVFPGANVNKCLLTGVRAYNNRGDGIFINGSDSQAHLILKPDVVANYGYGINIERSSAHCIIKPHANQSFNDSPGAYRDNGNSNMWESVYSEGGRKIVFGPNCSWPQLTTGVYARPEVVEESASGLSWYDSRLGFHKRIAINGADGNAFQIDSDLRPGFFRIIQTTPNSKNVLMYSAADDVLITEASALRISSATLGPLIKSGTGDPTGNVMGTPGSLYMRQDGPPWFYVKEGIGNNVNNWVSK